MKLLLLELVTKSVLIFMLLHLLFSLIFKSVSGERRPLKYTCHDLGCTEPKRLRLAREYWKSTFSHE